MGASGGRISTNMWWVWCTPIIRCKNSDLRPGECSICVDKTLRKFDSMILLFISFPRLQESGECLMIWACNEKFADVCYVPLGKAGDSMVFRDSGDSISGQRLPCGDVR